MCDKEQERLRKALELTRKLMCNIARLPLQDDPELGKAVRAAWGNEVQR